MTRGRVGTPKKAVILSPPFFGGRTRRGGSAVRTKNPLPGGVRKMRRCLVWPQVLTSAARI